MTDETIAADAVETPDIDTEVIDTEAVSDDSSDDSSDNSEASDTIVADSSDADTEEAIQDEIDDAETPAEQAAALQKMYKFKSAGKEIELDISNPEQMAEFIKKVQLADGAHERMQSAAEKEKAWKKMQEDIVKNPWKVMEEYGLNPDELAEQRIDELINESQKSPEQQAQEKMEAEVAALRAQIKEKEDKEHESEMIRLTKEAEHTLEKDIVEALSSTSELPKTPYVTRRIADAMLFAMDNGYDDVTAKQVLPIVEKEINSEIQAMFEAMPAEVMSKFIGQQHMDKLRKNRLKKSKEVKNLAAVKQTSETVEKKKEPVKKMTPQESRDFFRNLGKKK